MKKFLSALVICFYLPSSTFASYISNKFFVIEKSLDFTKKTRSGTCSGSILYPELSNSDEELFTAINKQIRDFAKSYAICNKGKRSNFSVSFDILNSGSNDFFSIRWVTKKNGNEWRVDGLNFNIHNGNLLFPGDILNTSSDNMMNKLIDLSEGFLDSYSSWEDFVEKVESRDVQFYVEDLEWYIVFNKSNQYDSMTHVKIPEYFLIGNREDDRG
jgi:hypothetical protein